MKAYKGRAGRSFREWLYFVNLVLQSRLRVQWCIMRWRCFWCDGKAERYADSSIGRMPVCAMCGTILHGEVKP